MSQEKCLEFSGTFLQCVLTLANIDFPLENFEMMESYYGNLPLFVLFIYFFLLVLQKINSEFQQMPVVHMVRHKRYLFHRFSATFIATDTYTFQCTILQHGNINRCLIAFIHLKNTQIVTLFLCRSIQFLFAKK